MKERTVPQVAVITADTPEQLQEKMNAELLQHPDVTRMTLSEGNSNRAIIQYMVTENVPEDEADRYFIETGKHYCCNDCPECIWDPDRRAVTHWCRVHEDRVRLKSTACDQFYLRLRSGDIRLVTAEERNARYEEMNLREDGRQKLAKQEASNLWKAKKREAKYAESLLKATTQLREEEQRLNDDNRPYYSFEMLDVYHPLTNKALHSNEVNLIQNGERAELTESDLIKLAKKLDADLYRLDNMTYCDPETITWDSTTLFESRGKKRDRGE